MAYEEIHILEIKELRKIFAEAKDEDDLKTRLDLYLTQYEDAIEEEILDSEDEEEFEEDD